MRILAAALLLAALALPAAADDTCDAAYAQALADGVARLKAKSRVLDSVARGADDEDGSDVRYRCETKSLERLADGGHDHEILLCVEQPGGAGYDVKALDKEETEKFCEVINACLFDLSDRSESPEYEKLKDAYDGLACVGE